MRALNRSGHWHGSLFFQALQEFFLKIESVPARGAIREVAADVRLIVGG
jgi:hypothetical protein